jgi:hypothetical protein
MRKLILIVLAFFILGGQVFSQRTAGQIVYAEGMGFTIGTGETAEIYDITYDNVLGMDVFEGDFISTDPGSFLELQMKNSGNLLKISENTSFTVVESGEAGGGSFELTYGRVRAKVDKLFNQENFVIRGPSVTAGVRGTDFGYDILADTGEEGGSTVNVYCFDGKVVVDKVETVTLEEEGKTIEKEVVVETIILEPDQMITLQGEMLGREMLTKPVEDEIRDFWSEQDFKTDVTELPDGQEEAQPEGDLEPAKAKDLPKEEDTTEEEYPEEDLDKQVQETTGDKKEEEKVGEPGSMKQEKEILTETERKELEEQYNNAGIGMLTTGFIVETIGVTTFFFGEELLGLSQPTGQVFGAGLMVSGGLLIGAAIYAFSQVTGLGK